MSENNELVKVESKELVKVERDPGPENLYADEGWLLLKQAKERGLVRYPSIEEVRAFNAAVRDMLKDIAVRHADHHDKEEEQD